MPLPSALSKIALMGPYKWMEKPDPYIAPSLRQAQQQSYEPDTNMFHLRLCISCKCEL